ncbi:type III-B CRISPR module RAMP protein Cmr4 [Methanosarcinales archaeon]|nr:MAG: type III-B CRISPR module RAMP protein Cmr4 [Methanosarcinales archaeon]
MYKKVKPFFMIVETPLHAGSGSDLGIVDLPIQRERHTSYPKIESSTIKGCIRNAFEMKLENAKKENIPLVFGPKEGDAHAGALGFTDARLLLFPVKSMKGVFAWVTCKRVLEKFKADLKLTGEKITVPTENSAPEGCELFIGGSIILEEYTFSGINTNEECTLFAEWLAKNILPQDEIYNYWREKIKRDIVVLSDDDFRDFVNLSTEVVTRTKINPKTGTVESGALFTEEYLPSESILYSLALATPIFNPNKNENEIKDENYVMNFFTNNLPEIIQIGGNSTLGKGLVRLVVPGREKEEGKVNE